MIIKNNGLVCIIGITFILSSCSFFRKNDFLSTSKSNPKPNSDLALTLELPIYQKFGCIPEPENPEIGYITGVIDGDSIKAIIDDQEYEIRYIGINSPEYNGSEKAAAELATLENKELVEGKKVFLFKDISNTDKYHRLLRYVFTEDYFVNYEMIKRGFAESKSYFPDISCQNIFNQAVQ